MHAYKFLKRNSEEFHKISLNPSQVTVFFVNLSDYLFPSFFFSDMFLLVTTVAYFRPSSFAISDQTRRGMRQSVPLVTKSLLTTKFAFELPLYLTELPGRMPDQFFRTDKLHNLK